MMKYYQMEVMLELLRSKLLVMMGVPMVLVVLQIIIMNMVMELAQMKML